MRLAGQMLQQTELKVRGGGDIKSSKAEILDKPSLSDIGITKSIMVSTLNNS